MGRMGLRVVRVVLVLLLLGGAAAVVRAAGEPAAGAAGGSHEPSVIEWRTDLGIWSLVVFGLLYLLLRKIAWGPMLQSLQKREETIHNSLEEARKAQEDAQRLRGQLQAEMNRAQEKVRDLMDEARKEAEQVKADMVAQARAEIQAEHERRRREIEMARDQALQALWNQAAQLATMVSAKVIRRQLTPDDHRRLVDEAIAELHQAGTQHKQQAASIQA